LIDRFIFAKWHYHFEEGWGEVIIKKRRRIKKRFFEVMRARERLD